MALGLELLIVLIAVGVTWRFLRSLARPSDLPDEDDFEDNDDSSEVTAPLKGGPRGKARGASLDEPVDEADGESSAGH